MSNVEDRTNARLALVPKVAAPAYADAMARLPHAQITVRRPSAGRDLPAVGSFHG